MEYIIEINDVSKKFKNVIVLDHVNLKIEKGTICGLIGMNGSGKTLLMKAICGFLIPDEGEVLVRNMKIGKECDFPSNIGVIIENPGFSQYLSGFKNLKNLASIQKKISDKKIRDTMEAVGLDPFDKKWVSKYSLGMRQRLGIAQAFMEDQDILILDEPMNGLDKKGVEEVRAILQQLKNQGKTILIASHNPLDIQILCDSVYEMESGRLGKNNNDY
jgi:ABC-2 type transport system ATP-binding protein